MLRTVAYFKHLVATSVVQEILIQCNQLISGDRRMYARLGYLPDLLMVVKDENNLVVGLLVLHFTVSTRAWEVGTMTTLKRYNREEMLDILIKGTVDAIHVLQERETIEKNMWLVKRVKGLDLGRKALFSRMGFECPSNWLDGVLSNAGYIPFDPFDTILMKRVV
jgi:hypothetical protein